MDGVSLTGVSSVAQHGVRLLLLVAEKQEWCFLVCFSGSPSYPVVWSSCWCRLCLATSPSWRLLEEFPLLRVLRRAIRTWKSGHCLRPRIFSPSVFGCCLWSTSNFRDACFAWFNSGYMFYERVLANFTYFLRVVHSDPWRSSPFRRMEKCAQLMLRVAVFLRAVRTLDLDIISTSSSCDGVGLTHFASFFALLPLSRS